MAYFCKAGDGVVDLQLVSDLHKSEVFIVAKELKVCLFAFLLALVALVFRNTIDQRYRYQLNESDKKARRYLDLSKSSLKKLLTSQVRAISRKLFAHIIEHQKRSHSRGVFLLQNNL